MIPVIFWGLKNSFPVTVCSLISVFGLGQFLGSKISSQYSVLSYLQNDPHPTPSCHTSGQKSLFLVLLLPDDSPDIVDDPSISMELVLLLLSLLLSILSLVSESPTNKINFYPLWTRNPSLRLPSLTLRKVNTVVPSTRLRKDGTCVRTEDSSMGPFTLVVTSLRHHPDPDSFSRRTSQTDVFLTTEENRRETGNWNLHRGLFFRTETNPENHLRFYF